MLFDGPAPLSVALVLATCAACRLERPLNVSRRRTRPLPTGSSCEGELTTRAECRERSTCPGATRPEAFRTRIVRRRRRRPADRHRSGERGNQARKGPDERGFVTALDVVTGKPLWTRALISWVHGDPVVHDGVAFVTFGRMPMTFPGGAIGARCQDRANALVVRLAQRRDAGTRRSTPPAIR